MKKDTNQVAWEPHPVSAERKAELRAKGLTIIDAVFAPEGYEPQAKKPEADEKTMSKAELQAALEAKGIEHKPAMSKAELQAALEAA
jgi:hypothetical protein